MTAARDTWGAHPSLRLAVLCDAGDPLADKLDGGVAEVWRAPAHFDPMDGFERLRWAMVHAARWQQGGSGSGGGGGGGGGGAAWVVWVNDHSFLVPENLACYLATFGDPWHGAPRCVGRLQTWSMR